MTSIINQSGRDSCLSEATVICAISKLIVASSRSIPLARYTKDSIFPEISCLLFGSSASNLARKDCARKYNTSLSSGLPGHFAFCAMISSNKCVLRNVLCTQETFRHGIRKDMHRQAFSGCLWTVLFFQRHILSVHR